MIEATLWKHLKPELKKVGKFQKISDRFTPGVPDVLGCMDGRAYAMELKKFSGTRILKVKFRPGQIDWLEDWEASRGIGLILVTRRGSLMAFKPPVGILLEVGVSPEWAEENSLIDFKKTARTRWAEAVNQLRGIHVKS